MNSSPDYEKQLLREDAKRRLRDTPEPQRACESGLIATLAAEIPQFQASKTVFVYLSRSFEADTAAIIARAWKLGKQTAAPRVEKHGMRFYLFEPSTPLVPGRLSILEPPPDRPAQPREGDFMAAPALLFDKRCFRLGNGGGYYDRYLELHGERLFAAGLCLNAQLADRVPTAPHDRPLDAVITPAQIIYKDKSQWT